MKYRKLLSEFKTQLGQSFRKPIDRVPLFNIGSKRCSGRNAPIKYLRYQTQRRQLRFLANPECYNYDLRSAISPDAQYLVRDNRDLRPPIESFHFLIDERYSPCQGGTVAIYLAYDLPVLYLQAYLPPTIVKHV